LRYSTSFDAVYRDQVRFYILYFYSVPVEFYLVVYPAITVQITILIKVTFITCPVCGVSVWADTICPVRFEPPEETIERVVDSAMSDLPERLYGV
jgi:uncharacterized membrane protein YwaF